MWRVYRKSRGRVADIEILDLRASGGPRPTEESLALPGLRAALLPEAFELAVSIRYEELEERLAEALVPTRRNGGPSADFRTPKA